MEHRPRALTDRTLTPHRGLRVGEDLLEKVCVDRLVGDEVDRTGERGGLLVLEIKADVDQGALAR